MVTVYDMTSMEVLPCSLDDEAATVITAAAAASGEQVERRLQTVEEAAREETRKSGLPADLMDTSVEAFLNRMG